MLFCIWGGRGGKGEGEGVRCLPTKNCSRDNVPRWEERRIDRTSAHNFVGRGGSFGGGREQSNAIFYGK